jgi:O-6-methylguanine DNA methyltransferase
MSVQTIYWHRVTDAADQAWTLLATKKGVCRLLYPRDDLSTARAWLDRQASTYELVNHDGVFEEFGVIDRLERYFRGQEAVDFNAVPLDLWGTIFQRKVWLALGCIPYGETRTYKQIAEAVGSPAAARAIGAANGRNPVPVLLPCHRVIGANGTLTGYRGGLRIKEQLLALEGLRGVEARGHDRFRF